QLVTVPITLAFFRGQFRWLSEKGHRVMVGASGGAAVSDFARAEGIESFDVPLSRSLDPFSDLRSLRLLVRLFRKLRPSVVHTHTPKAGLIGMLAAKIAGVPVRVYTIHGLPALTQHGPMRLVLEMSDIVAASCATRVLTVSRSVQQELARLGISAAV